MLHPTPASAILPLRNSTSVTRSHHEVLRFLHCAHAWILGTNQAEPGSGLTTMTWLSLHHTANQKHTSNVFAPRSLGMTGRDLFSRSPCQSNEQLSWTMSNFRWPDPDSQLISNLFDYANKVLWSRGPAKIARKRKNPQKYLGEGARSLLDPRSKGSPTSLLHHPKPLLHARSKRPFALFGPIFPGSWLPKQSGQGVSCTSGVLRFHQASQTAWRDAPTGDILYWVYLIGILIWECHKIMALHVNFKYIPRP